jgi:hypothetical protein
LREIAFNLKGDFPAMAATFVNHCAAPVDKMCAYGSVVYLTTFTGKNIAAGSAMLS